MPKLSHQEYVQLVSELIGEAIEICSEYLGANKPITYKCKKCGSIATIKNASDFIRNRNRKHPCRTCFWEESHKNRREEARKRTLEKIKSLHTISVLSEQRDDKENRLFLELHCKCCEHKWTAASNNIMRSKWKGCPSCWANSDELRKGMEKGLLKSRKNAVDSSREKFFLFLSENTQIILVSEYINTNHSTTFKCRTCDNIWETSPGHIMNSKSGCPLCKSGQYEARINYRRDIEREHGNSIVVLEEYINASTKILHKCNNCTNEWKAAPQSVKRGSGCPSCNSSRGENKIAEFLKKHRISYIPQWKEHECRYYNRLPFDFYLPDYNLVIEFQGIQHEKFIPFFHKSENNLQIQKKRDAIKKKYCIENDIKFLEIWHNDYENIHTILIDLLHINNDLIISA